MELFDLIIIGAGPTGIACGIAAKEAGLNVCIFEKGVLVNSIYRFPTNMTFFSTSRLLEIGNTPFISHSDKPTRMEALEYYRRVSLHWQLDIRYYEPVLQRELLPSGLHLLRTSKGAYQARFVVVATGYYDKPRMLHVPGEGLSKVKHFYDDAHPYVGQKLLVIGAANSACDVALETYSKGAEVTMAIREPEIYPKVKYWIKPNIENRIKEGSIKAYFNSNVKEIKEKEVLLDTPQGPITIANDFVLAMTGYQPDYCFLENLGLQFTQDDNLLPIYNPDTFESNVANLYIAGVICAGMLTSSLFIENTRHHGKAIVNNMENKLGKPQHEYKYSIQG